MTPIIPSLSLLFDFLLPRNISGTDFGTGYGLWFSYPTIIYLFMHTTSKNVNTYSWVVLHYKYRNATSQVNALAFSCSWCSRSQGWLAYLRGCNQFSRLVGLFSFTSSKFDGLPWEIEISGLTLQRFEWKFCMPNYYAVETLVYFFIKEKTSNFRKHVVPPLLLLLINLHEWVKPTTLLSFLSIISSSVRRTASQRMSSHILWSRPQI